MLGLRQIHWRIFGLVTLAGCTALAIGSVRIPWVAWPVWAIIAYWGLFLLLLLLTLYTAMVDLRYIRAEYAIMKRELFRDTIGDETLRKALIEAERRQRESARPGPEEPGREE